jgi:hypothetical protein
MEPEEKIQIVDDVDDSEQGGQVNPQQPADQAAATKPGLLDRMRSLKNPFSGAGGSIKRAATDFGQTLSRGASSVKDVFVKSRVGTSIGEKLNGAYQGVSDGISTAKIEDEKLTNTGKWMARIGGEDAFLGVLLLGVFTGLWMLGVATATDALSILSFIMLWLVIVIWWYYRHLYRDNYYGIIASSSMYLFVFLMMVFITSTTYTSWYTDPYWIWILNSVLAGAGIIALAATRTFPAKGPRDWRTLCTLGIGHWYRDNWKWSVLRDPKLEVAVDTKLYDIYKQHRDLAHQIYFRGYWRQGGEWINKAWDIEDEHVRKREIQSFIARTYYPTYTETNPPDDVASNENRDLYFKPPRVPAAQAAQPQAGPAPADQDVAQAAQPQAGPAPADQDVAQAAQADPNRSMSFTELITQPSLKLDDEHQKLLQLVHRNSDNYTAPELYRYLLQPFVDINDQQVQLCEYFKENIELLHRYRPKEEEEKQGTP